MNQMEGTIGDKIHYLRVLNDLSQEELGRRVGVQRAAINKYEKGSVTNIPIATIEKMASVFDVSPSYLVGWDGNEGNALSAEVKIIQGIKKFYGIEAVELLEAYTTLSGEGKARLCQYAADMTKLYGEEI